MIIRCDDGSKKLLETAPGVTVAQVREATEAELAVSEHVSTIALAWIFHQTTLGLGHSCPSAAAEGERFRRRSGRRT